MTHPRRYAVRMLAFLAVIAVLAIALHAEVERFFLRNPPLNTLILSVLAVGIVLSLRIVLSLGREVARLERYWRDGTLEAATQPSLLDPLTALLGASPGRAGLTLGALRIALDGIDSRLDERRDTSRYLIALLIFLGLLGTFWGLLITAGSVGDTIRALNVEGSDAAQMFTALRTGLEAPLAGMGTAFSTSLFGLASSLILGFLDLQAAHAQSRFASEVETWLTGAARFGTAPASDEGDGPIPAYVMAVLQQTAENLDALERRMARAADADERLHETLRQIAGTLERETGVLGEAVRTHARTLDVGLARVADDAARGRERALDEIRSEIRLLARTLAAITDRER